MLATLWNGGAPRRTGLALVLGLLTLAVTGFDQPAFGQRANVKEDRKCRHILVRDESTADQILEELRGGASFAVQCRRHSLDVVTKPVGGALGWIGRNSEPEFDQAAYAIPKVGEFAKCKTRYGWHVIELQDIRTVQAAPTRRVPPAKPETRPANDTEQGSAANVPPPAPRNQPLPKPNQDIEVGFGFEDRSVRPGEDVHYWISMKNNTESSQEVFNPELWPLGLTVRYQFGPLNLRIEWPLEGSAPEGGFSRVIHPGEELRHSYRLQDVTGTLEPWPIIRTNWRANIFFAGLERYYPSVKKEVEGYDDLKMQWRFYSANSNNDEEQYLNVLPDFDIKKKDDFFVMLHARGKLWFELADMRVPGLLDYWIAQCRESVYHRQPFLAHRPGEYFHAGGQNEDGTGHPRDLFELRGNFRLDPPKKGDLALEIITDGGRRYVGSRYYLVQSDQNSLAGKCIVVAHLLEDEPDTIRTMESLTSRYEVRGQVPRTMLGLVYTRDLLPPQVTAIVGDDSAPTRSGEPLPQVEIETEKGAIRLELYEDDAPNTVANFLTLAEEGFYDGLTFHDKWSRDGNRGYIQGGSPDGSVAGGAGYFIPDEKNQLEHLRGSIAAAKGSKPNTASSQFYICLENQPFFDGIDTVFGRVINGLEVADKIEKGDKIISVTVIQKRSKSSYEVKKATDNGAAGQR